MVDNACDAIRYMLLKRTVCVHICVHICAQCMYAMYVRNVCVQCMCACREAALSALGAAAVDAERHHTKRLALSLARRDASRSICFISMPWQSKREMKREDVDRGSTGVGTDPVLNHDQPLFPASADADVGVDVDVGVAARSNLERRASFCAVSDGCAHTGVRGEGEGF